MPKLFVRLFVSSLVVLQLAVVWFSLIAHRGTSTIQDDFLAYFDIYRTFGNWRLETNQLALASTSNLSESVWIEWHPINGGEDDWIAWPDQNRVASLGLRSDREQKWLRQLADLLGLGITEGASQMVASATRARFRREAQSVDRVRIMVSPTVPPERFAEVESAETIEDLPDDLRPQEVYTASLLSIGDGNWSLLPKIENRRVAPSIPPSQKVTEPKSDKPEAPSS
jgi:hypothetical protein